MKNPAGIKLCISHKIATSQGPLLKVTVLIKAIIICEGDGMYGLTVTSWGNPVDGMGDCFHLLCQAGAWDHIDCTVLMDGTYTLLDSETPPWLVFGYWAISVHYEVLWFAVFLNEKLDLWLFCLLAILDSTFPSFLAGVSHRDAGIGLGTFPTPWFAWALSAVILAVLSPLFYPSMTCPAPVCIPLRLLRLRGVSCGFKKKKKKKKYGSVVCFDLLHFLSGLHWWEV